MLALARYDAKRGCGIGVLDPGAVPGSSTILDDVQKYGAETGSTSVIKAFWGVRNGIRRYRAITIVANDNFVVANDNSRLVAIAA